MSSLGQHCQPQRYTAAAATPDSFAAAIMRPGVRDCKLFAVPADKMRAGIALTDEDRWPWLQALAAVIHDHVSRRGFDACNIQRCTILSTRV